MKILVIGLGNFGKILSTELSNIGHEVIGIDNNAQRVEEMKDRISLTYILDSTDMMTLKALPLDELDCVWVTIGRSLEDSLRTVAALKLLKVKRIYVRAIDETHRSILSTMGVAYVFIPEELAARTYAHNVTNNNMFNLIAPE